MYNDKIIDFIDNDIKTTINLLRKTTLYFLDEKANTRIFKIDDKYYFLNVDIEFDTLEKAKEYANVQYKNKQYNTI